MEAPRYITSLGTAGQYYFKLKAICERTLSLRLTESVPWYPEYGNGLLLGMNSAGFLSCFLTPSGNSHTDTDRIPFGDHHITSKPYTEA